MATTWRINVERVAEVAAAVQLLRLTAFLGPDAIPLALLAADPGALPADLAAAAEDELALDKAVGALRRYSLVSRDRDSLRVHRLVQVVVRADLDPDEQRWWAGAALRLIEAGFPRESQEASSWPDCAELLPHALVACEAAEHLDVEPQRTSGLLTRVGVYLDERAQLTAARSAYERALHADGAALGPDHRIVAIDVNNLGTVLRKLGDLDGARACWERPSRSTPPRLAPIMLAPRRWHGSSDNSTPTHVTR